MKQVLLTDFIQTGEGVIELFDNGKYFGYIALTPNPIGRNNIQIASQMFLHSDVQGNNRKRTQDIRRITTLLATGLLIEKRKLHFRSLFR
tara:strand:+ start:268 stop:537 length:270 start_codon:yes stop_codon:yes gene_type:complete